MDRTALTREVDAWSAADPDEGTRAELQRLLAAGAFAELEDRFAGWSSGPQGCAASSEPARTG